jgi:molybdopterin/thiamine biosynthesis adenylyltransferase/GNAT superfamily N-acetyltransferase
MSPALDRHDVATLGRVTLRRAGPADAERLSELFRLVYSESSHPFQSARDVHDMLVGRRNVGLVAEVAGRVVASMAMTYSPWNDSYELGRALTDPQWRRQGLAAALMQRAIDAVRGDGPGQLVFGFPRVRRMVDLCAQADPPLVVVGHDGGRNVANGAREIHLIVCAIPPHARFRHVSPGPIADAAFVRESIYGPLGLDSRPGQYPADCFVGCPDGEPFRCGDFLVSCAPGSPHRGLEILAHRGGRIGPGQIGDELDELLRRFPEVRHVTASVLADKVDLLRDLRDYGFEIAAYLPAWYRVGDGRFDCVQLARRAYAERPLAPGLDEHLARLRSGLGSLLAAPAPPVEVRPDDRSEPTWRPQLFRLASERDRRALTDLMNSEGGRIGVHDTLSLQLRDLIKTRHPALELGLDELDRRVAAHLAGAQPQQYGVWVYYPWSGALVHLLDEPEFGELRTNRNRHKITADEQAALATKRIGVVGLSVGQSVALTLALERAAGQLRLADFDHLDLSNLNRIRAGVDSLGLAKAHVTAREIAEIDPYLDVRLFAQGVTSRNVESFLLDGGKLDVIVEECDSLDVKVLVRQAARRHGIPVVMSTSDRGMLDVERFDLEADRPIFHGLAAGLDPAALGGLTAEQKVPYVLEILGAGSVSPRLRASMLEIGQTVSTWPQLASDVAHGGAAAAQTARRIALGQPVESGRFFLDLDGRGPGPPAPPRVTREKGAPTARRPAASGRRVSDPLWRSLVAQAILAPSGGNGQPWQWRLDGDRLHLFLDATGSCGLINFRLAGSYVALGCAAENLILAAHAAGREIRLELSADGGRGAPVATFGLTDAGDVAAEPHWRDDLAAQIAQRHTDRTLRARQPFDPADRGSLTAAVRSIVGADVGWLTGDEALAQVGALIGAADRLRLLHPRCHRELFGELRWTRAEAESTRDGIDVATLGLSPSDLAGLELCRDRLSLDLVRQWGHGRNLEKASRRQVAAASAVGLITTAQGRSADYFNGGRALERMWLTATERRLAVHPMTALPYLFARLLDGGEGLDEATLAELRRLRPTYERLFETRARGAETLLFRVGPAGSGRGAALRRPLDEVLRRARTAPLDLGDR